MPYLHHKNGLVTGVIICAVAAIYFGASKLGFSMAFSAEQVTVVWPGGDAVVLSSMAEPALENDSRHRLRA